MTIWRLGLWGAFGIGLGAVGWAAAVPIANPAQASVGSRAPTASLVLEAPRRVKWATAIVRLAPFRARRVAPVVAYDPQRQMTPPAQPLSKPVLLLVGLVAGPDPSAVIEGFPGVEGGRVVRTGDVIGEMRVVRIGAENVQIAGMDTVWVLTVRTTWR